MLSLDFKSRQPIYEQIYNSIVKYIALGVLMPNQQLQTVRATALELGVNPNTVGKAYQKLEQDGYIYSVTGKGSFVSDKIDADSTKRLIFTQKLTNVLIEGIDLGFAKQNIISIVTNVYSDREVEQ